MVLPLVQRYFGDKLDSRTANIEDTTFFKRGFLNSQTQPAKTSVLESVKPPTFKIVNANDSMNFAVPRLRSNDRRCGHKFERGELVYHCKDCSKYQACSVCKFCFEHSMHKHHSFSKQILPSTGGWCDCGDTEMWNEFPWCISHGIGNKSANIVEKPERTDKQISTNNGLQQQLRFQKHSIQRQFNVRTEGSELLKRKVTESSRAESARNITILRKFDNVSIVKDEVTERLKELHGFGTSGNQVFFQILKNHSSNWNLLGLIAGSLSELTGNKLVSEEYDPWLIDCELLLKSIKNVWNKWSKPTKQRFIKRRKSKPKHFLSSSKLTESKIESEDSDIIDITEGETSPSNTIPKISLDRSQQISNIETPWNTDYRTEIIFPTGLGLISDCDKVKRRVEVRSFNETRYRMNRVPYQVEFYDLHSDRDIAMFSKHLGSTVRIHRGFESGGPGSKSGVVIAKLDLVHKLNILDNRFGTKFEPFELDNSESENENVSGSVKTKSPRAHQVNRVSIVCRSQEIDDVCFNDQKVDRFIESKNFVGCMTMMDELHIDDEPFHDSNCNSFNCQNNWESDRTKHSSADSLDTDSDSSGPPEIDFAHPNHKHELFTWNDYENYCHFQMTRYVASMVDSIYKLKFPQRFDAAVFSRKKIRVRSRYSVCRSRSKTQHLGIVLKIYHKNDNPVARVLYVKGPLKIGDFDSVFELLKMHYAEEIILSVIKTFRYHKNYDKSSYKKPQFAVLVTKIHHLDRFFVGDFVEFTKPRPRYKRKVVTMSESGYSDLQGLTSYHETKGSYQNRTDRFQKQRSNILFRIPKNPVETLRISSRTYVQYGIYLKMLETNQMVFQYFKNQATENYGNLKLRCTNARNRIHSDSDSIMTIYACRARASLDCIECTPIIKWMANPYYFWLNLLNAHEESYPRVDRWHYRLQERSLDFE